MKFILIFLFLIASVGFSQAPYVFTRNKGIPISIHYAVPDTNELKILQFDIIGNDNLKRKMIYLQQLSSSDSSGSGWFENIDSLYAYDGIDYFEHPDPGREWARVQTSATDYAQLRSDIGDSSDVLRGVMYDTAAVAASDTASQLRSDIKDSLDAISIFIDPDMSDAQIQIMFDLVGANPGSKLIFKRGKYSTNTNFHLDSLFNVTIDGNVSTWDMNYNWIRVTTAPVWDAVVNGGQDYVFFATGLDGSAFTTNISADSFRVGIDDPSDWTPISNGDRLMFADSTNSGQFFTFSHFDTVGSDYYIYFQKQALLDILTMDSLLYSSSQLHVSRKIRSAGKTVKISGFSMWNSGWYVTGFENVQVSDMYFDNDITALGTDIKPAAMYLLFNQTSQVTNYFVKNYMYNGAGYGICFSGFDVAQLTNFYGYNCRHPVTTIAPSTCYNGELKVTNAHAYFPYENLKYSTGFDTHGYVWKTEFTNCSIEGAATAFNLRSNSIIINNCRQRNGNVGLNVQYAMPPSATGKHKEIIIDGFVGEKVGAMLQFDTGCGSVEFAKISNVLWKDLTSVAGAINFKDSSAVDTIIIKDSEFYGNSVTSSTVIRSTASPASEIKINYLEMDNVKVTDLYYIWNTGRPEGNEVLIKDCQFNNINYIFCNATADTSATRAGLREWKIVGTEFNTITRIFLNTTYSRWKNLSFENCEFKNQTNPFFYRYMYTDTTIIRDSKFWVTGDFFYLRDVKLMNLLFADNYIFDAGDTTVFTNPISNYLDADEWNWKIIGNKWFAPVGTNEWIYFSGGLTFSFRDNLIQPSTTDGGETYLIRISGATGDIINNQIITNHSSGTLIAIGSVGATDSISIDKNLIMNTGAGTLTPISQTNASGVLNLGINHLYNCSDPAFSGTEYWIPLLLYNARVDSITVATDTLYLRGARF